MRIRTTLIATGLLAASLGGLAACSPADDGPDSAMLADGPEAQISEMKAAEIPEAVRSVALATIPGMSITEATRKEREGMVFYDVEGTRPDGSEVELDMLEEGGTYRVVEIQRDLAWEEVPANVRTAFAERPGSFDPVRVIEGMQEDGTVLYELFADGKPDEPTAEVALREGVAEVLSERSKY